MLRFFPSGLRIDGLCAPPLVHLVFNTFHFSYLVLYELIRQMK